jgi:carboxyl-terminal processing protease
MQPRVFALGLFALLVLAQAACSGPLDAQTRELSRFATVYDVYVDPKAPQAERRAQLDLFKSAVRRVSSLYVSPTDPRLLIDSAIKGIESDKPKAASLPPAQAIEKSLNAMLATLDPHSSFLTPEQFKDISATTRGEFGGLGIEVSMEDGEIKVVTPIDGTPAAKAGLKAGDIISHIEGEPVKGMTIQQAVKQLRGPPDTQVRVTLRRVEREPFQVALTRAIIVVQPVRWRLEGDLGYVRLTTFNEHAVQALREAVHDIDVKSGKRVQGFVLDLRNNAGGLLDQAVKVADEFLEEGEAVVIRGRRMGEEHHKVYAGDIAQGRPIVVLINAGSASASEIVAGALQDHKRASILGVTSFGKGSVQTILPLEQGAALKLTTALYFTPLGRSIQSRGIEPDLVVTTDSSEAKREADLSRALPAAQGATLKPAPQYKESDCPLASDGKDRLLGCAISLLKAGDIERFLARKARTAAVQ